MPCVWRRGSNLCIAQRRRQSKLRQFRIVADMNQIVRSSRVVWVGIEYGLKNSDGFLWSGEILLVRRSAVEKSERIEDSRLLIVRKSFVQSLAFLGIGCGPLFSTDLVIIAIKCHQCSDISRLAWSFGWERVRLFDQLEARCQFGLCRCSPTHVVCGHGLAPVGDGAIRIFAGDLCKLGGSRVVPERMNHGHATLDLLLHFRRT